MKLTHLSLAAAQLASVGASRARSQADWSNKLTSSTGVGSGGGKKAFSLNQIRNPNYTKPDPAAQLIKTHLKYSKTLPEVLKKAVEVNADLNRMFRSFIETGQDVVGEVAAYPGPFDSEYAIPVEIGTPPQTLYIDVDTGSSDLWVFSSETYAPERDGHEIYRPENSSTSQFLSGESWMIEYGDMSGASGLVYQDIVRIGDTSYAKQGVEVAISVSPEIAADTFSSGILGMASSEANTVRPDPQVTYIQNILPELELPIFTANLKDSGPGNYNFGYLNVSEFVGDVFFFPMDLEVPYYQINANGYQIGYSEPYTAYTWNTIVDTGTSQLLVPQSIVDDYYAQVPNSGLDEQTGMQVFPCDASLPDFIFGLGEYRGRLPGNYVSYGAVNDTYCYGGIQSSEGIPFGVFGDTLLKAQFVVFDLGSLHVGFANKIPRFAH